MIPWTAACQTFLSFTISLSLFKLMFIVLAMPSNISFSVEPFFSCPQSFPVSESFPMSWLVTSGGQNIGASVSTSVLPEYSGLISFKIFWFDLLEVQGTLQGLFQHYSSKASVFLALSLLYGPTLSSIHDYWKKHSFDYTDLC